MMTLLHYHSHIIHIITVGNKCDRIKERAIPQDVAKSFARNNDISFVETSALDSTNVEEAFSCLVSEIYHTVKQNGIKNGVGAFAKPGPSQSIVLESETKNEANNSKCCKIQF